MNAGTTLDTAASGAVSEREERIWHPVVQVILRDSAHSAENRAMARAEVLDWAGNATRWRGGWRERIPESAYAGESFEAIEDNFHLQVSKSLQGGLWCFHVEHPDATQPRTWKLEAFVADRQGFDEFGVRVFCQATQRAFIPSNTPVLVRTLVAKHDIDDAGTQVIDIPLIADTDEDYGEFSELLHDRTRKLPVVVISQMARSAANARYVVNPESLARMLQGIAHVVALPNEQTRWLSDDVGRDLGVFNGAVRVYMPGFYAHAEKREHPLFLADRIVIDSSGRSFDKLLARRLRLSTIDSRAKLDTWPRVEQEVVATGRAHSLFEGLRRALGLVSRPA